MDGRRSKLIRQCSAVTKKRELGDDLLSHAVASAVPSALKGLTAVFEMGTGVSPSLWPPNSLFAST